MARFLMLSESIWPCCSCECWLLSGYFESLRLNPIHVCVCQEASQGDASGLCSLCCRTPTLACRQVLPLVLQEIPSSSFRTPWPVT